MIMGDLQLRFCLTYSLLGWTFVVWRSEPVQLGEPNRIHDSKFWLWKGLLFYWAM